MIEEMLNTFLAEEEETKKKSKSYMHGREVRCRPFRFFIVKHYEVIRTKEVDSAWIMDSKKDIMFERMREKKKEVKIVRRIVLGITLILLLIGLIGGRSVYKYITGAFNL